MKPIHKDPLASKDLEARDRRFLMLAKKAAAKSSFRKKQVGVLLVKGNKIVVQAHNYASHTVHLEYPGIDGFKYWSLHAEIAALNSAKEDARKTTAYLFGFKNGRPGNSKPCPLCERYLRLFHVQKVVHTTPFGGVTTFNL